LSETTQGAGSGSLESSPPRPPSVHPATFPRREDGERAAWLAAESDKVQRIRFGTPGEGGRPPSLRTLPPPPRAPGIPRTGGTGAPAPALVEAERAPEDGSFPSADEPDPGGGRAGEGAPGEGPGPSGRPMPPAELEAALNALMDREEAAAQAAMDLAVARRQALAGAEERLIALAVAIAEALVGGRLEDDPELHGTLAREALATLGVGRGASPARLRASEAAYQAVNRAFGGPRVDYEGVPVEVVRDPALEGFGYIAENDDAQVDARIPSRLDAVRRALVEERRRRVAGAGDGQGAGEAAVPSAGAETAKRGASPEPSEDGR